MLNCDLAFASLAGQCADRADSQACYHQSSHLLGTDGGSWDTNITGLESHLLTCKFLHLVSMCFLSVLVLVLTPEYSFLVFSDENHFLCNNPSLYFYFQIRLYQFPFYVVQLFTCHVPSSRERKVCEDRAWSFQKCLLSSSCVSTRKRGWNRNDIPYSSAWLLSWNAPLPIQIPAKVLRQQMVALVLESLPPRRSSWILSWEPGLILVLQAFGDCSNMKSFLSTCPDCLLLKYMHMYVNPMFS